MSSRDRVSNFAIGFVAVAAVVTCIAIADMLGDPDRPSYRDYPDGHKELADKAPVTGNRRPPSDRSICNQTETEKEYELCQAWRSAQGAREAADTAWKQFLLSVVGLLGVALTVYYAKRAADGAISAARAAQRSAVTANKTLRAMEGSATQQLRPYVGRLQDFKLDTVSSGNAVVGYGIAVVWRNNGATPARRVRILLNVGLFDGDDGPWRTNYPDRAANTQGGALTANQTIDTRAFIPISDATAVWVTRNVNDGDPFKRRIYYWGWVEYDGFQDKTRHRTEICARLYFNADPRAGGVRASDAYETEFNAVDTDCVHAVKT